MQNIVNTEDNIQQGKANLSSCVEFAWWHKLKFHHEQGIASNMEKSEEGDLEHKPDVPDVNKSDVGRRGQPVVDVV